MYYFIINPNSSSGKGLLIWKSIEPVLKERNVDYHPFFTKDRESTAHLVKRLCTEKAPATIVAVGGDGTVNDVLNGLANFENITFGYIPSGSGNDLARGPSSGNGSRKSAGAHPLPHPDRIASDRFCLRPGFFPAFSREQRSGL